MEIAQFVENNCTRFLFKRMEMAQFVENSCTRFLFLLSSCQLFLILQVRNLNLKKKKKKKKKEANLYWVYVVQRV